MPLFEFKCPECGHIEEKLMKSSAVADMTFVDCPDCMVSMQRQISAASFAVNGQFTSKTGYANEQVRTESKNGITTTVKGHFEQHDNITQRRERIQSR
jgi:putative FmdB family regulatory protein